MAEEKRIKITEDREAPFNDSGAITRQVDMITENLQIDGAVYLGLGALTGLIESNDLKVDGVVHLRMTPKFARHLAERLVHGATQAEQQFLDLLRATQLRRTGTAN